ncbi:hypothetical protein ASPVEDRAFT_155182 [Aspergillus versicolor CBS 583.65]|uniref:Ubiquitin 3 binding protein But2 C-terminal domain-containing protein n=1 Tax=Aspergillus versicolor CBS 583.65 TaxID=1036611 RepID=A0A1L9Q0L7_ASPVE|nr:uncharacterized protein ASPVEDRAFT_155182 [Aspergillus versicolor CBS 583.65]OJJ07310.1 hypothetical protein ASPVEDRAFT_155182 [Aspergillus versicolor CBS 583.65]
MRCSLLATLGLCASSALAAGPDDLYDIAVVEMTALGQQVTDIKNPRENECVAYDSLTGSYSVGKVVITPLSPPLPSPHVRCTFDFAPHCQVEGPGAQGSAQEWTMDEGTWTFSRDFVIKSYKCFRPN